MSIGSLLYTPASRETHDSTCGMRSFLKYQYYHGGGEYEMLYLMLWIIAKEHVHLLELNHKLRLGEYNTYMM